MADPANHILLPWVAPGLAANIPDSAAEQLSGLQAAAVSFTVSLVVNNATVEKTARFYGPGDVTGIDPLQVVRVEPRHRTPDFEPNYFPSIEFDRPDFPWLFTPAKADPQGRLRPWLCLVVVRKQAGVECGPAAAQPLPVLAINAPARPADELPDLSESHLWAHCQVTGSTRGTLTSTLNSQPAKSLSRLLCPRRLDPGTEYIACVVPAFDVGRRAGLSLPVGAAETLAPAWTSGADAPDAVTLPVYYSWEFRTGVGGDFEELVRRLRPRALPPDVGKRSMDIARPGFPVEPRPHPDAPGTILGLEGALRVVGSQPDAWPDSARIPFQSALSALLNTPWRVATSEGAQDDPILAPPIYGAWHAAVHQVPQHGQAPATWPPEFWLDELNLDPRHRAVAAMGTQVIQEQQESLMASAWAQLGDIERINQRLRQAQLSRAVNTRYHVKVFSRLPEEAFFKMVAPALSRVAIDERPAGQTPDAPAARTLLAQRLARSFVPPTAVSSPLRKLARARGAINRQFTGARVPGVKGILALFNAEPAARPDPAARDRGAITIDQVSQAAADALAASPQGAFIWNPDPPPGHWERQRVGYTQMLSTFRLASLSGSSIGSRPAPPATPVGFREAAIAHHGALTLLFTGRIFIDVRRFMVVGDIKAATLSSLHPDVAVSEAARSSVNVGSPALRTGDDLDPIMDAPVFPQPMYEALRDLSQDYLFPGLEHVPPNTVQLLQTNATFIESFMVGLNAEMGRELLWRGYPTDQRGTYFRQFWDTAAAGNERPDIIPVHQWGRRALGTIAAGAVDDKLVLLIRGELLRRYPGTVIYAVRAATTTDGTRVLATGPTDQAYPIFRGALDPDVVFIGFDLASHDVVEGDGWFFVFQQQPTEPRFGLDDDPFGIGESGVVPELTTWNDLNWGHIAPNATALKALSHIPAGALHLVPTQPDKGIWGRNSAHMAYITKQRLVRIAIHATELLP